MVFENIIGTMKTFFQIGGTSGPTIRQDSDVLLNAIGNDGDIQLRTGNGGELYVKSGGIWRLVSDISLLSKADGNFIVGNGAAWTVESDNTARTSLGLGTGDSPTFTGLTLSDTLNTSSSILVGSPTGGDQGAGSINAESLYIDGVLVTAGISDLNDLSDVTLTAETSGNILYYNGSAWINEQPGSASGLQSWNDNLDDIAALAHADGNIIVSDGTDWVVESGNTARTSLGVGDTDDVTHNSLTATTNVTATTDLTTPEINRGSAGSVDIYTDVGANNINIGGASSTTIIAGNLQVDGNMTTVNSATLDVTDKNITVNDGGTTAGATLSGINIEGDAGAVVGYLRSAADNSLLEFKAPAGNILTLNMDADHSINLTASTAGEVIRYNGSAFINDSLELSDIDQVTVTGPTTGDILYFNGTNWVNQAQALSNVMTDQITGADSQLSEPMIFITDTTRSNKLLSSESTCLTFANDVVNTNDYFYLERLAGDVNTGAILPYPGTIVRITGHTADSQANTSNISIYVDGTENTGQLLLGGSPSGQYSASNTDVNINFNAGQKLRVRGRAGTGTIRMANIQVWVKWRTT